MPRRALQAFKPEESVQGLKKIDDVMPTIALKFCLLEKAQHGQGYRDAGNACKSRLSQVMNQHPPGNLLGQWVCVCVCVWFLGDCLC